MRAAAAAAALLLACFLLSCCLPRPANGREVAVRSGPEFYAACCDDGVDVVRVAADFALHERDWPASTPAPCTLGRNLTITGYDPARPQHYPTVNMNYVGGKVGGRAGGGTVYARVCRVCV